MIRVTRVAQQNTMGVWVFRCFFTCSLFLQLTRRTWRAVVDVAVRGHFLYVRWVCRREREQRNRTLISLQVMVTKRLEKNRDRHSYTHRHLLLRSQLNDKISLSFKRDFENDQSKLRILVDSRLKNQKIWRFVLISTIYEYYFTRTQGEKKEKKIEEQESQTHLDTYEGVKLSEPP